MSWVVLSKREHRHKALRREVDFSFAKQQLLVQICSFELLQAVTSVPVVFVNEGEAMRLCGVMGLEREKNLLVNPSGQWDLKFIPAALQCFPFRLGDTEKGSKVLLFNEKSGLIVDEDDGIPLFDESGNESEALKNCAGLLLRVAKSNAFTNQICETLEQLDLFEPLNITIKKTNSSTINLEGLFKINVDKLNSLASEEFLKLRKYNALEVIYGHLFSLTCFSFLVKRMELREKADASLKDLGTKIFEEDTQELDFNF